MSERQPPIAPQQGLPPTSQPFPGSLTPGWNDPPSVQYNPTPSGSPGRTKLNKRVPFPLQNQMQSNVSTKPTAIVQPCTPLQNPNPIPGNSGNIAVVHPLQHTTTQETTAPQASVFLPPVTAGFTEPPTSSQTRESSHSLGQAHAEVPTMFVPAVPRQTDPPSSRSTVQHL